MPGHIGGKLIPKKPGENTPYKKPPLSVRMFREKCKAASEDAFKVLYEAATDPKVPWVHRVNAAKFLVEGGYGKSATATQIETAESFIPPEIRNLSTDELIARIKSRAIDPEAPPNDEENKT